jgi:plasmid stabilization system protein ParE
LVTHKKLPIKWDSQAKDNLGQIYDHIAKDSISTARHVMKSLVKLAHSLIDFPENHSKKESLIEENRVSEGGM